MKHLSFEQELTSILFTVVAFSCGFVLAKLRKLRKQGYQLDGSRWIEWFTLAVLVLVVVGQTWNVFFRH